MRFFLESPSFACSVLAVSVVHPPCLVTEFGDHLSQRASGYCEHHHGEYMLARRRWQSARNNFRRGASPNDPGPWADRVATVSFTAQDVVRVTVTKERRDALLELSRKLDADLEAFTLNARASHRTPANQAAWVVELNQRVTTMLKAAQELRRIAYEGRA